MSETAFELRELNRVLTAPTICGVEVPLDAYKIVNQMSNTHYGETEHTFLEIVQELQRRFPKLACYLIDERPGFNRVPKPPTVKKERFTYRIIVEATAPEGSNKAPTLQIVEAMAKKLLEGVLLDGVRIKVDRVCYTSEQ